LFDEGLTIPIALIVIYIVVLALVAILGIVMYILRGMAIYRMSQARGLKNGWLGFIPYVMYYQLGSIAGEIELGNKKIKNTGLWLLLMPILYGAVLFISYLIMLIPIVAKIISLGDNPTSEEVLSIIPIMLVAIFIVAIIATVAQLFLYLFNYLALHKIFSQYSGGQKPVYYLIIAIFIPYADTILLFRHRNRPLLPTNTLLQ